MGVNGYAHMDQEQLLYLSKQGDKEAYAQLFMMYENLSLRVAFRVLRNPQDAEDAVQEAYMRTSRKFATQYDLSKGTFQAWLATSVQNAAIDHYRQNRRRYEHETEIPECMDPPHPISIEREAEGREELAYVMKQIDRLPERVQVPLRWRACGHTGEEIAYATGVPLGTVKTRTRYGLKRIHPLSDASETAPSSVGEFYDADNIIDRVIDEATALLLQNRYNGNRSKKQNKQLPRRKFRKALAIDQ